MPYTKKRNGKTMNKGNKTKKLNGKNKKQQDGGMYLPSVLQPPSVFTPSHGQSSATGVKSTQAPPPLPPREENEMIDLAVLLTEYKGEERSGTNGLQEAFTTNAYFVIGYGNDQKINKDKLYRFYENLKEKIEPKEIDKKITIENNSEEIIIGLNNRLKSNTNPTLPGFAKNFAKKLGNYKEQYNQIKDLLNKKDLEIIETLASESDFDEFFKEGKLLVENPYSKELEPSKIQKIVKFNLFISILQYVLFILHKRYINEYYLPQLEINKKFYENKKKTEYPEGLNLRIEKTRLTKLKEEIEQIGSNIDKLNNQLRTRNNIIGNNNITGQMLIAKTEQKEAKVKPLQKLENDIKEYRKLNTNIDNLSTEIKTVKKFKLNDEKLMELKKKEKFLLIQDNMEKVYYYYFLLNNKDIEEINILRQKIKEFFSSQTEEHFLAKKFNFENVYIYKFFKNLKVKQLDKIYKNGNFDEFEKINVILVLHDTINQLRTRIYRKIIGAIYQINNQISKIQKKNLVEFCKYFIYHLTSYNLIFDKNNLTESIAKKKINQVKTINQYILNKNYEFIVFKLFFDDIFKFKLEKFISDLGNVLEDYRKKYEEAIAEQQEQPEQLEQLEQPEEKQQQLIEEKKIIDKNITTKQNNLNLLIKRTKKSRLRKLLNKFKTKKRKIKNKQISAQIKLYDNLEGMEKEKKLIEQNIKKLNKTKESVNKKIAKRKSKSKFRRFLNKFKTKKRKQKETEKEKQLNNFLREYTGSKSKKTKKLENLKENLKKKGKK